MSEIAKLFKKSLRENAERDALIFYKNHRLQKISYGELEQEIRSYGAKFKKQGIKNGSRILVFAPFNTELCAFMIATMLSGLTVVYVDIWAKQDRLKIALKKSNPDFIAVSKKTALLKTLFPGIKSIKKLIFVDEKNEPAPADFDFSEVEEFQPALMTMTTGSSDTPKIAVRSHENLSEQSKLINQNLKIGNHEVFLVTSYMYVFSNLLAGHTTVLPGIRSKEKTSKIEAKLRRFNSLKVSTIFTTPDFCIKSKNQLKSLKTLYIGGAILNLYEAKTIADNFKNVHIKYIYGSTECCVISSINLKDYIDILKREKISNLGKPAHGVKVKIKNNNIFVSSPALLKEYVGDKNPNHKDENGVFWHNTGDAGLIKNGELIYLGKSKQRIKNDANETIFASEIEQRICVDFPEIRKCAVLKKHICLESDESPDVKVFENHLRTNFSFAPEGIELLKHIPTDVKHHTKIDYKKLEEIIK